VKTEIFACLRSGKCRTLACKVDRKFGLDCFRGVKVNDKEELV
jgi:hypothetical protein